jgi:Ca2+-transporting ATPase
MFTAALRQSGAVCAVTGESINDAMALSEADVGFCMGSGCAVAKDHSDLIFLDDDFSTIFNAVKWGRNIFENCRKFIQFQLTVNISCIFFILISSLSLGASPFTVVQLLWINLIMDVLAAIALASEAPHPTELKKERIKKGDNFVVPIMWRAIWSQVLY